MFKQRKPKYKFSHRLPEGTTEGNLRYNEVIQAYVEAFQMNWWQELLAFFRGVFQIADAEYEPVDEELVQMVLDADLGDREDYEVEWYDCDDFAFNLMGVFHQNRETAAMPIFITWINMPESRHAVLSYVDFLGKVRVIEPQNDEIYFVPKGWSLMLLCG